jgi:hypothetical protein
VIYLDPPLQRSELMSPVSSTGAASCLRAGAGAPDMTEGNMGTALEQQARRAAKRAGLWARKSRRRAGTVDNHGEFMLIDPSTNFVVAGERFDLTPREVIEHCTGDGMP